MFFLVCTTHIFEYRLFTCKLLVLYIAFFYYFIRISIGCRMLLVFLEKPKAVSPGSAGKPLAHVFMNNVFIAPEAPRRFKRLTLAHFPPEHKSDGQEFSGSSTFISAAHVVSVTCSDSLKENKGRYQLQEINSFFFSYFCWVFFIIIYPLICNHVFSVTVFFMFL